MEQKLLQHILEISRLTAETRDLSFLLNHIMDEAIALVGAERGYVVLVQPDGASGDPLDFCVQKGQDGQILEGTQDQVSRSVLHQVVETGQPLVLRDALEDSEFGKVESVVALGLRSLMCVPMVLHGDTIGAIYVENRSSRGHFADGDALPLLLFANQAAVAIENARLFQSLQQAHDRLEFRVQERTQELARANELLEQEIVERAQAEEALRAERDRVQHYLDIAASIMLVLDAEGNIALLNRQGCHILECDQQKVIGQNWFETFVPHKARKQLEDNVFATIVGGDVSQFEYREGVVVTGKGNEKTIRWHNSIIRDDVGRIIGTLSSGEDITKHKKAEEALRESEERFSLFMDYLPAAVFMKDEKGLVQYVNRHMEELFGLKHWAGQTTHDLYPPGLAETMVRDDAQALATGYQRTIETVPDRNGVEHVYHTQKFAIERAGRSTLLGGIALNITEQVRAEEGQRKALEDVLQATHALRESEHMLTTLLEVLPVGICLTDEAGRFVLVNDAYCRTYEFEREAIIGQHFSSVMPPDQIQAAQDQYAQLLDGDMSIPVERKRQRRDGTVIDIEAANALLVQEDGERFVITVVRDITERKRTEQAIHRLYEQTARDAKTKTMLLREVNHRVKNNLTGIIGLIHTEQRYATEQKRAVVQEAMERLIQRINALAQVHDILSWTEWAPVSLSNLATHILSAALDAVPLDRQIVMDVDPSKIKVLPQQANNLALVLNELVTNAIKYATSGGTTTHLAVQIDQEGDDTVLLEIRDSGPGYPPDVLRLERHGVGLYLVKILVEHALGGSLLLANDGGAVTAIRFRVEERNES